MPKASVSDGVRRGRVLLHDLLESKRADRLPPWRWTRSALLFVNDLAGRPLCSQQELERLETERAELKKQAEAEQAGQQAATAKREAAPVVLYVTDQDFRTRKKIEDILKGRDIPYLVNEVTDDESSRSWALTQAKKTEFPLLFVAGVAVGGVDEVLEQDVRGELRKKVFG